MRSIPFVTNRPPMTGGFGPPTALRDARDALIRNGGHPALRRPGPARPARPAPSHSPAPSIAPRPGTDAALVAFLTRVLTAAVQADQTPIVMVHGYSYSFSDAVIRAADLCAWFEGGDFPVDLAPIAFTWPSVDGLSPEDYLADRGRAAASANAYSRFMLAFAAASAAAGRPRCLYLAHSMGNLGQPERPARPRRRPRQHAAGRPIRPSPRHGRRCRCRRARAGSGPRPARAPQHLVDRRRQPHRFRHRRHRQRHPQAGPAWAPPAPPARPRSRPTPASSTTRWPSPPTRRRPRPARRPGTTSCTNIIGPSPPSATISAPCSPARNPTTSTTG